MWQNVIVLLIVIAAGIFVVRRLWLKAGNTSWGGCGCSGCGSCPGSEGGTKNEL